MRRQLRLIITASLKFSQLLLEIFHPSPLPPSLTENLLLLPLVVLVLLRLTRAELVVVVVWCVSLGARPGAVSGGAG